MESTMFLKILATVFLFLSISTSLANECLRKKIGDEAHVCVCNSTYCDTVPPYKKQKPSIILMYTSNKDGLRFYKSEKTFTRIDNKSDKQIIINSDKKYQSVIGWGGAFTDSTGINIDSLDDDTQENLLKSYFSNDGIEYNLCRVPIGGTDFSTKAYSYDDGDEDPDLKNFQLTEEDFRYKIPFIKKATNLTKNNLLLFGSAWTAPKWMKTNDEYNGLGFIRPSFYQTWANYHVKFLDEYKKHDIKFWGLTTGNQPVLNSSPLVFFSKASTISWTTVTMSKWIDTNFGPTLKNSSYSNIKIMTLDDQRCFLDFIIDAVFSNQKAWEYVDGIALHWYFDTFCSPNFLNQAHKKYPEKFLIYTETCVGAHFKPHVVLGSWERAEKYADSIIEDMLNWVTGWVDWNMALDLEGGPTYIKNFVDSPIIVDSKSGEFYKQPMFYAIGHFSKFVSRGSVRVESSYFDKEVLVVAFRKVDNGTTVVILNKKNEDVLVELVDRSRGIVQLELSRKSITTLLYW